ncbi:MAG: PAS domain S-box protein [Planctomycetes bacterium]|nr:PAS domain S-box protein [Planctomycetota bacterium]
MQPSEPHEPRPGAVPGQLLTDSPPARPSGGATPPLSGQPGDWNQRVTPGLLLAVTLPTQPEGGSATPQPPARALPAGGGWSPAAGLRFPWAMLVSGSAVVFVAILGIAVLATGGLRVDSIEDLLADKVMLAAVVATLFALLVLRRHDTRGRQLEARFRAVTGVLGEAMVCADETGRITTWSEGAAHLFGHSREEMLGRPLETLVAPRNLTKFRGTVAGAATPDGESAPAKGTEFVGRRLGGGEFPMEMSLTTWIGARGVVRTAIFRDITARRRTEEALRLSDELLRHLPDAIILTDLDGRILRWLGRAEEIFGFGAEEAVGQPLSFLGDKRLRDTLETRLIKSAGDVGACVAEVSVRRKDGTLLTVETSTNAVRDADDRPLYMIILCRDVTERRMLQEDLDRFFALSMDIFCIAELDGGLLHLNPAWETLTGWPVRDLKARSFADLVHPDDRDHVRNQFRCLARRDDATLFEARVLCRDGTWRAVLWNVASLTAQRVVYAVGRDITDEKRAAQALRAAHNDLEKRVETRTLELTEANAELRRQIEVRTRVENELHAKASDLERSNRDLEEFAYFVSHDLQEPLRVVANYAGLLGDRLAGHLDIDCATFLEFIGNGAKRMKELVSDMLEYARLEAGPRPLEEVETAVCLNDALSNLGLAIGECPVEITADPLPVVFADRTGLTQILQNLVGNALKYRGEHPPVIHVSCRREADDWIFGVRDNGPGIEPGQRSRLFTIFSRIPGGGTTPGTGIGLALCKRIVERHEGRIWVESEVGRGSEFKFTIPFRSREPGAWERAS